MSDLQIEYLRETEDDTSIASRVTWLASRKALENRDIIDRGISTKDPFPQYGLDPGLYLRVQKTVRDQRFSSSSRQNFLRLPSGPSRHVHANFESCFDSGRTSYRVGRIEQETGLVPRISRQVGAYRATSPSARLTSPISTDADIYEHIPTNISDLTRMTYVFDNVPHMQDLLIGGYDKDTGYLPDYLSAPRRLREVFPQREQEERPSTVYSSSAGEQMERSPPER
ncbi:hypothetical protein B0H17DRAFT_1260415 [Mycena rosella]|uniref:Uncharacterized protein n=1 Tax=Mycena rosella TaxID=1033263 RepID=A0AAD7G532_MYCRO|nr:hypothetical protein B0H17DRAFT_1260415 [Mycena rosella]